MEEPQNPYAEIQEPKNKPSFDANETRNVRGIARWCLRLLLLFIVGFFIVGLIFIVGLFALFWFGSPDGARERRFEQSVKFEHSVHDLLGDVLASGADINSIEGILHKAVEQGEFESVRILLDSGYDINSTACLTLETPLHRAVTKKNITMVKLLIYGGADLNLGRENDGQTPLDMAQDRGFVKIEQLLRANGASISQ